MKKLTEKEKDIIELVKETLIRFKGQLVPTADFLDMRYGKLSRLIDAAPVLRMTLIELDKNKPKEGEDQLAQDISRNQITNSINARIHSYRMDALNVIHEISTMELTPATADVKLKASVELCKIIPDSGGQTSSSLLDELALAYAQAAPRLRGTKALVFEEAKQITVV